MAKTNAVERLKSKEFTVCSNFCEGDYSQKESRQRIVISSPAAVNILETETGSCDPVSDYCVFVTTLIPVSVRTLPSSAEPPIETRL